MSAIAPPPVVLTSNFASDAAVPSPNVTAPQQDATVTLGQLERPHPMVERVSAMVGLEPKRAMQVGGIVAVAAAALVATGVGVALAGRRRRSPLARMLAPMQTVAIGAALNVAAGYAQRNVGRLLRAR